MGFSTCVNFKEKVIISHPFIRVICRNTFYINVYENIHATVILTEAQKKVIRKNSSIFSVLMVGIDSISKQNLMRTMPKSYEYLEENFINLKGYNKIGENTFPNLMAILTGQNTTQLEKTCSDTDMQDKCDFLWKTFRDVGFMTAYGEDTPFINTFNYARKGFSSPPTDYYYRPYFIAAEKLSRVKSDCHARFCAGPEASGERTLNNAKDFSITFKSLPSFGLFWTNAFSHDNINCPSAMDDKILQFLSDENFISSLSNTIFIFF
ncbi:hypothetical protein NQ314_020629 [Rhamnusium bicolor]|uniref:Uncharacterized protein n=1 Tax=Rhamnusium bicolor TaxID=1586634 RepID=A0AAV8WKE2_9CUCU|nr:hypothetical protein NQ314_020629 [Rhamnusium bicolor]